MNSVKKVNFANFYYIFEYTLYSAEAQTQSSNLFIVCLKQNSIVYKLSIYVYLIKLINCANN